LAGVVEVGAVVVVVEVVAVVVGGLVVDVAVFEVAAVVVVVVAAVVVEVVLVPQAERTMTMTTRIPRHKNRTFNPCLFKSTPPYFVTPILDIGPTN
jgi:hypothetical protein